MTQDFDVAIVGAGAAGIAAAARLAGSGLSVVLLEANDRLGGRAYTQIVEDMPIDMGCGWLHSGDRNPWTRIAEAQGLPVDRSPSAWHEQYRDLGFSKAEQVNAEAYFEAWRDRLDAELFASDRASDALTPGHRWNGYAQALSSYMNGAVLDEVSIEDYLAYDRASTECNWRVQGGYGALIASILPAIETRLSTPVTTIDRRCDIVIETGAGSLTCRGVIVTVSTAILAAGKIRFLPAINDRLHAAACLPLGLADKLFLAIDGPADLEAETHLLGNPHRTETGSYYIRPFGRPMIECFYGGPAARAIERSGQDAAAFAMEELTALLGADIRRSLRVIAGSAWGRAEWIGGSYSHALPRERGRRAELAAPVDGRLFFAGEATDPDDFSTAHGAYQSGVRAAEEVMGRFR